jgi:drug/metabolite transporter (DMT)-like permease
MLQVEKVDLKKLGNVALIVIGVAIASFGEIDFVLIGFLYQLGGILFEAIRLCLVQKLLNGDEFKMNPLVSLYYFAPVCAAMNVVIALVWEVPKCTMAEVYSVGLWVFLANAGVAFALNVSVVFLVRSKISGTHFENTNVKLQIGRTSGLVLTLCGVLKDIMLVTFSILVWGTPISNLQAFGYSIAIIGMLYYKLGQKELKPYIAEAGRRWSEFGANRPVLRKLLVVGAVFTTIILLLGSLAPTYAPDYNYLKNTLGTS